MIGRILFQILRATARGLWWLGGVSLLAIGAAQGFEHFVDPHPTQRAAVLFNALLSCVLVGAAMLFVATRLARRSTGPSGGSGSTSQGSARWGSSPNESATEAGLLLGRSSERRGRLVRYAGDAHLLTLAPTGAGKGVGCVIPNLLSYPGSVLVTDPKGENYIVSARRRRELGHRVMALDPFDLVHGDASFNPLEGLDPSSPDGVDDAAALAEMLVVREPRESGDTTFWAEEAKALLAGLVLHVAAAESGGCRTLATVWEYLSLPPRALTKLWTEMAHSSAAGGAVARAAARVRQKGDRVRSGILAQAQSHAHFLESPRLARVMRHSSFSFADLKTGLVSLYVVLPPDRIDACRRWLRLMVGCALHSVVRTRGAPRQRVLLLLDEFPALGPMPPLERAVSLARGYGVTCWLLAQDLAQLKSLYPVAWPTFVANAGIVQTFGINDVDTASYISSMLGTTTVAAGSRARSHRLDGGVLGAGAEVREVLSETDRARALLSSDEVRRLGRQMAILLSPGADPVRVSRLDYRRDAAFRGMYDGNPLHGAAIRD